MVMILQLSVLIAAQTGEKSIRDYIQDNIKDVTIHARIERSNLNELKKINKDYVQNFAIDSSTVRYKEPFKLRVDSKVEDTTFSAVYNGVMLRINAPSLHVSSRQDLTDATARRETSLDFGILAPCLFPGFFTSRFVRVDRETGDPVFDLNYTDKTEQARFRIWIDPVRHIVTKREWYNRYGTQLATFYYEMPKQFDGIWLATRITVKNVDNKVAGVTRYDSVKFNTGLADSIFSTGR